MARGLVDEEDRQTRKMRRKLYLKRGKTAEEWQQMWDLAPPLMGPGSWFWSEPSHLTPHLSPSASKQIADEEQVRQRRREALPPIPRLQGPPPSPYSHLTEQWKPQKRKESYPAHGVKKHRKTQE